MNVECDTEALDELSNAFRYNDAVIRNLVLNVKRAATEPSPLLKEREYRSDRPDTGSHDSDKGRFNKKPAVTEDADQPSLND